jgi:ABC-type branched-subunit amino acid transport system substrate-binding protein
MKKISLLLLVFLFGCQSLIKPPAKQNQASPKLAVEDSVKNSAPLIPKFDSTNLGISKSQEKKIQVALFLPMSGKNKDLGNSLFNSAILSLFDNDINHNIELILIDSKETPQEANKAFEEIINRKIKIVIGPVFGDLVSAIETPAKKNHISVISLSNNHELAKKINDDGGVFVAGMLLETQIEKIVGFAIEQDKSSFAVIAPKNQYGAAATSLFKKIIQNRNKNFITADFYKNNDLDLNRAVNRVVNSFTITNDFRDKKSKEVDESDRLYPQIIFVPETGKMLSKIAAAIKKENVDERNFKIIGTSQWDEISTLNDQNLVGSWFAAPQSEKFREFEKKYYQIYSKFPPRISSISYDLVAAISQLIDAKNKEIPKIKDFINYSSPSQLGFDGIDGNFRFLPNGLVQRNLAVLQVGLGNFQTIQKPVAKFLKY